jgi:hypothetical protein
MNPGSDSQKSLNGQVQSIAELEAQLKTQQEKAQALSRDQAVNKLVQGSLKRSIDEIKKNVQEFRKDGESLKREFGELKTRIEQKLHCVREELGEAAGDVEDALCKVDKDISDAEGGLLTQEESLTGDLEFASNKKSRASTMSQSAYEQLAMKSLKQRVSDAQSLWKESNGVPGVGNESAAEVLTLLWLARERLSKTIVVSEIGNTSSDFIFPPDWRSYEKQLVDAYNAAQHAATDAFDAAKKFDDAKSAFSDGIKSLGALRASRKTNAVWAARDAVRPRPTRERQVTASAM